jgi:ComF family protein
MEYNRAAMLLKFIEQSTTLATEVYKRLFINHCVFCLEPNKETICLDCLQALPLLTTQCPCCAEPNVHGQLCGHCLKHPPAFDVVFCPYILMEPISIVITQFKRHAAQKNIHLLIHSLSTLLDDHHFDYIIPLPYHWHRLIRRGHNPVRTICKQLARETNFPLMDGLKRIRSQHSQKGLNRRQRLSNLSRAFVVRPHLSQSIFAGKNLLLVDDVLTTGATCNSAALTLKKAGAKSVCVACLARTPPHI